LAIAASGKDFRIPNAPRLAMLPGLWQTMSMTTQQANQPQRLQHREDYKIQKLVQRLEKKLALNAKAVPEPGTAPKN